MIKHSQDVITIELIAAAITESFHNQRFLTLHVFGEMENREVVGIVTQIDQQLRRIKVSHEWGIDWIPCDEIISVKIDTD